MVTGGGALGKWIGPEAETLANGNPAFWKRPHEAASFFPRVRTQWAGAGCESGRRPLTENATTPVPWSGTSSFQNDEIHISVVYLLPCLRYFVTVAQRTKTGGYHCTRLADEKIEAQRSSVTYLGSHRWWTERWNSNQSHLSATMFNYFSEESTQPGSPKVFRVTFSLRTVNIFFS